MISVVKLGVAKKIFKKENLHFSKVRILNKYNVWTIIAATVKIKCFL